MERDGHLGITLLLYTPIAALLSTTVSTTVLGLGVAAMTFWSLVPDVDLVLPIPHRGPTHSFVAAGFAGILTAVLAVSLVTTGAFGTPGSFAESAIQSPLAAAVFGFGIGVLGVGSHLLGDVVTPMGIRPWWPHSDRKYSLSLVLSADPMTNFALSFTGAAALIAVLVLT